MHPLACKVCLLCLSFMVLTTAKKASDDAKQDGQPDKPQLDICKMDTTNQEEMMKLTKKGKTVMMFVKINNFKSKEETEEMTSLWQTELYKNNVKTKMFLIEDDGVMFIVRDGEHVWQAKDFLVEQERCEEVQIEQQTFRGKYAVEKEEMKEKKSKKDEKNDKEHEKGEATLEKDEL